MLATASAQVCVPLGHSSLYFVTRMALSRAHTSAKAADQVIPQSAASCGMASMTHEAIAFSFFSGNYKVDMDYDRNQPHSMIHLHTPEN